MTRDEMVAKCQRALDGEGPGLVMFSVEPGRKPPGFPRGELINEVEMDGVRWQARVYNARKMLNWLNRPEIIEAFARKEKLVHQ